MSMQASLGVRKDLESHHHCRGPVKLVNASLHVKNNPKSRFYHCGGPVKLGQGNINANRDFQCIFHYCGGRAGQFVCQRRYRNQFSPLWRS